MRKYSRCKYTLEERLQIIKEYETSSLSGTEVARKYGLNSRNVIAMWRYRLQDSKKGCNFAAQKQNGALDEWLSQRSAKPSTAVRIRQAPPTKEGTNDSLFPLFLGMPVQIFSCPRPCRSPLRPSPSPEGRLHPAPECNFNYCSTVICSLFRLPFVPVPVSIGVRLCRKPEMNFCSRFEPE